MSGQVVLINPFRVPADKLAEAISYWESHRDFLMRQPGYISTKLHQALDDQGFLGEPMYKLINVAVWESQAAFNLAAQRMRSELGTTGVEGLVGGPALFRVIRE